MRIRGEIQQAEFDDLDIRISARVYPGQKSILDTVLFRSPEDVDFYRVDIRLPTEESYSGLVEPPPFEVLQRATDPTQHGSELFKWLFQDKLADAFRRLRWGAESSSRSNVVTTIRLRLWLDPSLPNLQALHWESLYDPDRGEPLCWTIAFARVAQLESGKIRPLREGPIRMLLVSSSPEGLGRYDLSAIDADLEAKILLSATEDTGSRVNITRLKATATLSEISSTEAQGYHIAHVLSHAVLVQNEGYLLLPDQNGVVQQVSCEAVAKALTSSKRLPYLVTLATPLSGDQKGGAIFLKLAPLLTQAGVQAVVVIPAPIGPDKLLQFTERLYGTLFQTGNIDLAMMQARNAIYESNEWDWVYPVLYTRASGGQIFELVPEDFESLIGSLTLKK